MTNPVEVPWTAFDDGEIWARDETIGAMQTAALAREACDSHNAALAVRTAAERGVRGGSGIQIGHGGTQYNNFR